MASPRVILVVLLVFTATSAWSRQFKTHDLRQFNAGQDSYYSPGGGTNYGTKFSGKECAHPRSDAWKNGEVQCASSGCRVRCNRNYNVDGKRMLYLACDSATGRLTFEGKPWEEMPPCSPVCKGGCPEGSECVAPRRCEEVRPAVDTGMALHDFVFECDPPCQNGGTCIFEDVCNCPQGYAGHSCVEHRCPLPDLMPSSATIGGPNTLTKIVVECYVGYKMSDGLLAKTFNCHHGRWVTEDGKRVYEDVDVNCYA